MIGELVGRARQRVRQQQSLRTASERTRAVAGRAAEQVYGRLADDTPIWERDWDVLCVLDACRLDLMRSVADEGQYDYLPPAEDVEDIWSVGSQSAEWMDRTFAPAYESEMERTAYLTGNPFSGQACEHMAVVSNESLPLSEEEFGLLYEAWRTEWLHASISTIPPRALTDAAVHVWRNRNQFDVDRIVVHYMQPHAPFRSRAEWFYGNADLEGWGQISGEDGGVGEGLWEKLRQGVHSREAFEAAYRDNLEWVLDDLVTLVTNCDGDVVLTSDHGNAHGEWGVWSHPPGVSLPSLRRVPWVQVEGRDTGSYEPDPPAFAAERNAAASEETDVEERLADLGYL
jgi:hypothetical protein